MTHPADERADLLDTLASHRYLFLRTVEGLTDEQARLTPIPSTTLSLGGLVKHVAATEDGWARFVVEGTSAQEVPEGGPDWAAREREFTLLPDETLAEVLAFYREVAERTDALVRTVDLDLAHPLPAAPWFRPGATRSARRVFTHVVAETAQHAGHADLLREALDGQKTMG
ncbi:DinB family protein [Jatrophihabitans sp. YIM 134969]